MHSHGEGPMEVFFLRYGEFPKLVDVIIYPESNSQVEVSNIILI